MLLNLFEKILNMSLMGCYIILVVFIVRLLLRKCERKYSYFLWFVVFLNLCLPISIQAPFSLIPKVWVEASKELATDVVEKQVVEIEETNNEQTTGVVGTDSAINKDMIYIAPIKSDVEKNTVADSQPATEVLAEETVIEILATTEEKEVLQNKKDFGTSDSFGGGGTWQSVAGIVWIIGLTFVGAVSIYKAVKLCNKLKKYRKEQALAEEGVVYVEEINTPFLWGIVQPIIYLPGNIEADEKRYIIAHESYHRRRFDHIAKPVVFAIACIHWFNPLVWIAYIFFIRDMEISCDEAVLSHAEGNINKQYAESLLKYAAKQNGFVLSPLTFGEPSLKSRISNVLRYKKRGLVVTMVAVCLVGVTACGLLVRPRTQTEDNVQSESSATEADKKGALESVLTESEIQTEQLQKKMEDQKAALIEMLKAQEQELTEQMQVLIEEESSAVKQRLVEEEIQKIQKELAVLTAGVNEEYPEYYQLILVDRLVGSNTYAEALGIQESLATNYINAEAEGALPSYGNIREITEEEGYLLTIPWIKFNEELILENLTFDLKEEIEAVYAGAVETAEDKENLALPTNAFVNGVYYDEEVKKAYIVVSGIAYGTWIIEFSPEEPKQYTVLFSTEKSSWFEDTVLIGDDIYTHSGSSDVGCKFNLRTGEMRSCDKEYEAAKAVSSAFSDEYESTVGIRPHVCWFYAIAQVGDVELYSGTVREAMDFPTLMSVYVAFRDGNFVDAMLIDEKTGQISYMDTLPTVVEQSVQTQEKEPWFNENYSDAFQDRYPAWMQTVLAVREESGKNARDFGWGNSVLPVFSQMTGQEEDVFGDSGKVHSGGDYLYECWMKLPNGVLLENLSFDLSEQMIENCWTTGFCNGVFYREDLNKVYIVLPVTDVVSGVMLIAFAPDAPQDYEVHSYRGMSVWFGETVMVGDDICLHGANGSSPYRINIDTWRISHAEQEFEDMKQLAASFAEQYKTETGKDVELQWFYASGNVGDVEVYTGYIGEDVGSEEATIYTAYEGGIFVGAMIINERSKEIVSVAGVPVVEQESQAIKDGEVLGVITYAAEDQIVIDEKKWVTWQDEEWKPEYSQEAGFEIEDVSEELVAYPIAESCTISVLDEYASQVLEEYPYASDYKEAIKRTSIPLFHLKIESGKVVSLWEQYLP